MKKLCLIFISILFLNHSAFAVVKIDITRGNLEPLPTAISKFYIDKPSKFSPELKALELDKKISEVISNNLKRSGLFSIIDPESYIQSPRIAHAKPTFQDWALIKAQIMISGKLVIDEKKRLRVEFRLWDVVNAKEIEGLALFATPNSWRRIAHIISDKIYERMTGELGYFDTRIIYVAESGPKDQRIKKLAIMDQDGANNKYLTLGNELVLTPRFNPASQMVTYMSYFKNLPRVYLLNIETGMQELVGDFPGMTFAPRFSPDGKKIIMSFAKDGNSDIYSMDIKSRVVEQLTSHPSIDTSPSYSSDGSQITFNSDRSGAQQIYVMKSDGSKPKRISFGQGLYGTPVWSPRGDLIAFTKIYRGKFYIGVMRSDGTGERLLTENYYQEAPSWSPNGRVLIFYRESRTKKSKTGFSTSSSLWSIDLTGYNERKIKTLTDASDPAWSGLLSK
ncbi:Tol-Pal system beta propeller repeat protein TolB [Pelagibacteraceae bacterium]|nr:Tol-Pal system beta propeller repeat protein TolB [Pelagibacteraceae bacterium]